MVTEIRVKNRLDEPIMVTVVVEKIMVKPEIKPNTEQIMDCGEGDEIVRIYISKAINDEEAS